MKRFRKQVALLTAMTMCFFASSHLTQAATYDPDISIAQTETLDVQTDSAALAASASTEPIHTESTTPAITTAPVTQVLTTGTTTTAVTTAPSFDITDAAVTTDDVTHTVTVDCIKLNSALCKQAPLEDTYDVNGDGCINAIDSVLMKREALAAQDVYVLLSLSKDNVLYAGETVAVTLSVERNPGFSNGVFRFDLEMDQGLTPVLESGELVTENGAAAPDVIFNSGLADDFFAIYTASGKSITEDGELVTFYLQADADMEAGTYPIRLSVTRLSTPAGEALPYLCVDGSVQVLPGTRPVVTTAPVTQPTVTTTTTWYGIDVSRWQGTPDWQQAKDSGVEFAMLRAGYGKEANQVDPSFYSNLQAAQNLGIPCGAYWYSYALTAADARREAQLFLQVVQGHRFEFPLVLDIEETSQRNLDMVSVSTIIDAFCTTMEQGGYYTVLYSYASFLNTKVLPSTLDRYDVWVAHTNTAKPDYARPYGMWQYSHKGTVPGISGSVDLNYAYRNYPALMKQYHVNGY